MKNRDFTKLVETDFCLFTDDKKFQEFINELRSCMIGHERWESTINKHELYYYWDGIARMWGVLCEQEANIERYRKENKNLSERLAKYVEKYSSN